MVNFTLIVQVITVIANIVIAVFAYKAFKQSQKARRYASFETVFAQMLAIQRSFFDNRYVNLTPLKDKSDKIYIDFRSKQFDVKIDVKHPVTQSFAEYYKKIYENYKDTEFSLDNLKIIWGTFVRNLVYEEYFNNCFKYIYNVINLIVQNEELSDEEKTAYVERVQALLNKNEMFCYLINLLSFYSMEGLTKSRYINTLKKYGFFDDLFRSYQLSDIIKKSIPNNIISAFWEKKNQ